MPKKLTNQQMDHLRRIALKSPRISDLDVELSELTKTDFLKQTREKLKKHELVSILVHDDVNSIREKKQKIDRFLHLTGSILVLENGMRIFIYRQSASPIILL